MVQISKIIKAWLQVAKGSTTMEHKQRSSICQSCDHAIYKKYLDFIDDDLKEVRGMVCNLCDCPLIAKIRSSDVCVKWKNPK